MGLVSLQKRSQSDPSSLLPRETMTRSLQHGQGLTTTRLCWCLDLECPQTVRNKFPLFLNHPVCGITLEWPEKMKTLVNYNIQLLKKEKYHGMKYPSILITLYL